MKLILKKILICLVVVNMSTEVNASDYDMPDDIDEQEDIVIYDKFESTNRKIFDLNRGIDNVAVKPATKVYGKVTFSEWGHERIKHAIYNLYEPNHMINSILYRNPAGFFRSSLRFMINTVFGIGGLFDVATKVGIKRYDIKFADVMAGKMCMKNGPYLMLPLLGPSTTRNTIGLGMDKIVLDPFTYILPFYGTMMRFGVEIVSTRYDKRQILSEIHSLSVDEYAMMRSLYYQSEAAKEFTICDSSKK